jgi:hypothetical protein
MMSAHSISERSEAWAKIPFCTECGAENGELTSECCGQYLPQSTRNEIARKKIDYKSGEWIDLDAKST